MDHVLSTPSAVLAAVYAPLAIASFLAHSLGLLSVVFGLYISITFQNGNA
jgi:hypothetical protein